MSIGFLTRLPRLQFSLRTLFITITLLAIWFGYHVNWIDQRREARKWIDEHVVLGRLCEWGSMPRLEDFPWTLELLGEEPRESDIIAPNDNDKRDLKAYRKRAAQVAALFPESNITDISEVLEQMGAEIE